jgi:hypothetical protein
VRELIAKGLIKNKNPPGTPLKREVRFSRRLRLQAVREATALYIEEMRQKKALEGATPEEISKMDFRVRNRFEEKEAEVV